MNIGKQLQASSKVDYVILCVTSSEEMLSKMKKSFFFIKCTQKDQIVWKKVLKNVTDFV